MSFKSLGLSAELVRAVSEKGYTEPTPIQAQAIPVILEGRDLMGSAQTGTGKTASFTLPLLQLLASSSKGGEGRRPIRSLVITPTRELAAQVTQSVEDYGKWLSLKSVPIFGGVSIRPQKRKLEQGVDILIATPGRLLDHVSQKTVNLSKVELLVLDEADRMLDMGFIHDIKKILKLLPKKKQTLLFSATFSGEIKKLADGLMHSPALVEVARPDMADEVIEQIIHPVDKSRKRELLSHLIGSNNWKQVLVFGKTKHGADRLTKQLITDGIKATAIHGNKSQSARTKALADFKAGKVRALVATDIAARGLDINQLPHVVNFELPNVPEDYIHRIGRTGRAGREGQAVSLVSRDEMKQLREIERLIKREIPHEMIEDYLSGKFVRKSTSSTGKSFASSKGFGPKKSSNSGRGSGSKKRRPQQKQHSGQARPSQSRSSRRSPARSK